MLFNACRREQETGQSGLILAAMEDVPESRARNKTAVKIGMP